VRQPRKAHGSRVSSIGMNTFPAHPDEFGPERVLAAPRYLSASRFDAAPAWWTSASLLAADVLALSAIYWAAVIGRRMITPGGVGFYLELFPGLALFFLAFAVNGLYPGVLLHPAEEIRRVFHSVSIVFLLVMCTTFLWHNAVSYSRSIIIVTWALAAPAVLLARKFARQVFPRYAWWGVPAVVFGSGAPARRIVDALRNRELGVRVTAVVSGEIFSMPSNGIAHYAILAEQPSKNSLHRVIRDHCKGYRHVLLVPDIQGLCSLGITARDIGGELGLEVPQKLFHRSAGIIKRGIDLALTIPGLIILSPLFLLIAAAIKLTSNGPVLYGHTRHGLDGKTFAALKFRTMVQDGESVLRKYFEERPDELAAWKSEHKLKRDPRVTSIGKWLRRSSLDELPQLWNVLLGQMSLVGPRPIVTSEVLKYGRGYDLYSRVRPGITGLWQVSGRNNTTYSERVAFDEYYVRNWSIWLDTYILVRTAKAVINADGAY
jgi:Undecaprenyl-phosphate galactose phosphotransferase WbaP